MKTPNTQTAEADAIIDGFFSLAYSRRAVRLQWANYWTGDRATSVGDRATSLEVYRQDRNSIRRATRAIKKATRLICWRNKEDLSKAMLKASRGSRLQFLDYCDEWEYTAGQYQQTEIRWECARLLERAEQILKHKTN